MSSLVELSVDMGHLKGETYRFEAPREFMVGRANDCDIQVPVTHDYLDISLHHCTLHIEPPKIWLSVQESKKATFVNELKISPTVGPLRLYDEGEVQLGLVRMLIHIVEHDDADSLDFVGRSGHGMETTERQ